MITANIVALLCGTLVLLCWCTYRLCQIYLRGRVSSAAYDLCAAALVCAIVALIVLYAGCAGYPDPECNVRQDVLSEVENYTYTTCHMDGPDAALCVPESTNDNAFAVVFLRPNQAVVYWNVYRSDSAQWGSVECEACNGKCITVRGHSE